MNNTNIKEQAQNLKETAINNVVEQINGINEENKLKIGRREYVYIKPVWLTPVFESNGVSFDFINLSIDKIIEISDQIAYAKKQNIIGKGTPCYTVLHSVCCDGDDETVETLGVFSDREHARAVLKLKRDEYVELAEAGNLWIDPNNQSCKDDFTDTPDCYNIWNDGYYSTDHVLIKVVETKYHKKH
jgi:hypothetical protein